VGAWGTGLYQDDDALDLRDRWRELRSVGFDARDVARTIVEEFGTSSDGETVLWLALADLAWRAGRLTPDLRRRALRIIEQGRDLERWDDPRHRRARARVLAGLARTLASRMPAPRPPKPAHPCDWRPGELIVWGLADGGSAVLRVVSFDPKWGGGGSPVVELVAVAGPDEKPLELAGLETAAARRASRASKLASGRSWRGTRFAIGVLEPGTYHGRRLRRVRPGAQPRRFPRGEEPLGTTWNRLDRFLHRSFGVPWAPGTVLRVELAGAPVWLVVIDLRDAGGEPGAICEVLDWPGPRDPSPTELRALDVHRTSDTISAIRARIVIPANRMSVATLRGKLGVRGPEERVPFRLTLCGPCPPGSTRAVGRRPVVVPRDYANATTWDRLGAKVAELRGAVTPAGEGASPAS
jgi:hypothetical protein